MIIKQVVRTAGWGFKEHSYKCKNKTTIYQHWNTLLNMEEPEKSVRLIKVVFKSTAISYAI